MTKLEQKQALETILFVATKSLSPKQLAEMIGGCETGLVRELVSELNAAYEKTDRVFRIDLLQTVCRCTHFRNIKNGHNL